MLGKRGPRGRMVADWIGEGRFAVPRSCAQRCPEEPACFSVFLGGLPGDSQGTHAFFSAQHDWL